MSRTRKQSLSVVAFTFIAALTAMSCTPADSISGPVLDDYLKECSDTDGFVQAEFTFQETWTGQFPLLIKHSENAVHTLDLGGKNFTRDAQNLASIQMRDRQGRCLFEIDAFSFQAISLELYLRTFAFTGLAPFQWDRIDDLKASTQKEIFDEAIFLSASVLHPDNGASYGFIFLILDNEIQSL